KYIFLQSIENNYDWQHWNIKNGIIGENPIKAYMTLKYKNERNFSFKWKDPTSDKVAGEGDIFWEDLIHGKMWFYEYDKHRFNYRNIYHRVIKHQENHYDAIFINA